jgi:Lar family restriction alleviation protein
MSELKPCPFCGGKARLGTWVSGHTPPEKTWLVQCSDLGCYARVGTTEEDKEDAITNWNTRASSSRAETGEPVAWYCINSITGLHGVITDKKEAERRKTLPKCWQVEPLYRPDATPASSQTELAEEKPDAWMSADLSSAVTSRQLANIPELGNDPSPLYPIPLYREGRSGELEEVREDAIWHDLTFVVADFLQLRDEALEPGEADEEERQASAEHLVASIRSALASMKEG